MVELIHQHTDSMLALQGYFIRYLQDAFKVPLVIQLTDDEKCMWKNLSVEERQRLARENAKDIVACGFDVSKTFIFSDFDYVGGRSWVQAVEAVETASDRNASAFYKNMVRVAKCVTYNKVVGIFGFTGEDHIGKVSFPPVQAVPSFPSSFPHLFGNDNIRCLIPCAIDQCPLVFTKRTNIRGEWKMSANDPNSAIYVTDSAKEIKNKINRYAFSGGQDSIEKHRKYGANLEVDIPFKYLGFFLDDDKELDHIREEYGSVRMLTGEIKKRRVEVLTDLVERHRRARAAVTDEMVDAFMAVRPFPNILLLVNLCYVCKNNGKKVYLTSGIHFSAVHKLAAITRCTSWGMLKNVIAV
ncbi:hypothetical protein RND71_042584 [Anisodus tanguticus]|uniref:Tryptophan--tRNA ligase, cytoplasmic n=1 Tax=Anisodus tanguticus TaxID=243964 RepID=A0AAE1QTP5_9SOLA|nr:hypothetical protein RND71_042584 [Anisodus tanguticus]